MAHRDSVLTKQDRDDFLLTLYFGSHDDPLSACVSRAYRDFSRTLHGMAAQTRRTALIEQASTDILQQLNRLRSDSTRQWTQTEFDAWHRESCENLSGTFDLFSGPYLHVGQAQKWINMAMKYVYSFGEYRIPGFAEFYPHCHVPLDWLLVERLAPFGAPNLSKSWSRLDNYDEYMGLQQWVRDRFDLAPLDVEFFLWLGKPLPR